MPDLVVCLQLISEALEAEENRDGRPRAAAVLNHQSLTGLTVLKVEAAYWMRDQQA